MRNKKKMSCWLTLSAVSGWGILSVDGADGKWFLRLWYLDGVDGGTRCFIPFEGSHVQIFKCVEGPVAKICSSTNMYTKTRILRFVDLSYHPLVKFVTYFLVSLFLDTFHRNSVVCEG